MNHGKSGVGDSIPNGLKEELTSLDLFVVGEHHQSDSEPSKALGGGCCIERNPGGPFDSIADCICALAGKTFVFLTNGVDISRCQEV